MRGEDAYDQKFLFAPDDRRVEQGYVLARKHGRLESPTGDLLLRVASLMGEIEALKRERHAEGVLSSRLEFASVYFRKRGRAPIGPKAKAAPNAA